MMVMSTLANENEGDMIRVNGDDDAFQEEFLAAGWMKQKTNKGKAKAASSLSSPLNEDLDEFSLELNKLQTALSILHNRSQETYSPPGTSSTSLSGVSTSSRSLKIAKEGLITPSDSDKCMTLSSSDTFTSTPPLLSTLSSFSSFQSTPMLTPSVSEADTMPATPLRQSIVNAIASSSKSHSPTTSISPRLVSRTTPFDVHKYEVKFRVIKMNDVPLTRSSIVEALVKEYPELCEAPARMYAPDGTPLPLTKKQETSKVERQARKDALVVSLRGQISHSLLQVSVLLQSRGIIWRRVGDLTTLQQRPVAQVLDSSKLDPWGIQLIHSDVDIHEMAETNVKKTFEISKSRRIGKCDRCEGSKKEDCRSCRGSDPDECWWCKGSGKSNDEKCKQCAGKGELECKPCQGSKKIKCGLCRGEGMGLYAAFLQVSMTRVDFEMEPLSTFMKLEEDVNNLDLVQKACLSKAKEMIATFLTKAATQESIKRSAHRQHRIHQASASLNYSASHLLQFNVPQEAKVVTSKKASSSAAASSILRPSNIFHRKIHFTPFYCILPSDPALHPVQLSKDDFSSHLSEETFQPVED